jgi:hypothetical protein
MTVQNLYTQYLDGKITKQKFLYEVRRDQNLDMISPSNSFDDVVKILKNKSIISEKAHKEAKKSEGKQEVDIIAKTIDMVNPYEYSRGMEFELNIMDVSATSGDLSEDSILKAQKKVLANLTKNPSFYFDKINGKGEVSDEWVEVTKKEIDKIGKGKAAKGLMREGLEEEYETIDKTTRYDVTLRNGKSFSGVKFINKNSFNTANGGTYLNQEIDTVTPTDEKLREGGNLGHNEISSIHPEGAYWVVTYRGPKGTTEKSFKSEEEARKFQDGLDEGYEDNQMTNWSKVVQALSQFGSKDEIKQYLTSLHQSGDTFETVDDYVEDFRNYVADKSLEENKDADLKIYKSELNMLNKIKPTGEKQLKRKEFLEKEIAKLEKGINEHGEYFDRVSDMNISQSPLEEAKLRIYEKYAQKMNKTIDEVKCMVDEAIALKDKAGNIQYAKDSTEASNIEKNAKSKGITLTKTAV